MTSSGGDASLPRARLLVNMFALPAVPAMYALTERPLGAGTAGLVAAALPTAAVSTVEFLYQRAKPKSERISETVRGDVYQTSWLVVIYVVLALQLLQAVIGFLVGFGVGVALAPYQVDTEVSQSIALTALPWVALPLLALILVVISRAAAHRIRDHALAWISLAIVVNLAVNLVTSLAILDTEEFRVTAGDAAVLAVIYGLYFGAAAIGVVWAKRSQDVYTISKLYRDLSPSDRQALIEVAIAVVPVGATSPQSEEVPRPVLPSRGPTGP
jgi:hypothetical protein